MPELLSILDREDQMTEELRDLCRRRIWFALSRYQAEISHIEVLVYDDSRPRGGIAKSCRVSVVFEKHSPIVVNGSAPDLATCISQAADRTGRTVARAINRMQKSGPVRMPHRLDAPTTAGSEESF